MFYFRKSLLYTPLIYICIQLCFSIYGAAAKCGNYAGHVIKLCRDNSIVSSSSVLLDTGTFIPERGDCNCRFNTSGESLRISVLEPPIVQHCLSQVIFQVGKANESLDSLTVDCLTRNSDLNTSVSQTGSIKFHQREKDVLTPSYCIKVQARKEESISVQCEDSPYKVKEKIPIEIDSTTKADVNPIAIKNMFQDQEMGASNAIKELLSKSGFNQDNIFLEPNLITSIPSFDKLDKTITPAMIGDEFLSTVTSTNPTPINVETSNATTRDTEIDKEAKVTEPGDNIKTTTEKILTSPDANDVKNTSNNNTAQSILYTTPTPFTTSEPLKSSSMNTKTAQDIAGNESGTTLSTTENVSTEATTMETKTKTTENTDVINKNKNSSTTSKPFVPLSVSLESTSVSSISSSELPSSTIFSTAASTKETPSTVAETSSLLSTSLKSSSISTPQTTSSLSTTQKTETSSVVDSASSVAETSTTTTANTPVPSTSQSVMSTAKQTSTTVASISSTIKSDDKIFTETNTNPSTVRISTTTMDMKTLATTEDSAISENDNVTNSSTVTTTTEIESKYVTPTVHQSTYSSTAKTNEDDSTSTTTNTNSGITTESYTSEASSPSSSTEATTITKSSEIPTTSTSVITTAVSQITTISEMPSSSTVTEATSQLPSSTSSATRSTETVTSKTTLASTTSTQSLSSTTTSKIDVSNRTPMIYTDGTTEASSVTDELTKTSTDLSDTVTTNTPEGTPDNIKQTTTPQEVKTTLPVVKPGVPKVTSAPNNVNKPLTRLPPIVIPFDPSKDVTLKPTFKPNQHGNTKNDNVKPTRDLSTVDDSEQLDDDTITVIVVGSVIGILVFIAIIVILATFLRSRRSSTKLPHGEKEDIEMNGSTKGIDNPLLLLEEEQTTINEAPSSSNGTANGVSNSPKNDLSKPTAEVDMTPSLSRSDNADSVHVF